MYANSVDPDQMPHSATSDLGLHCLQRPICPNSQGHYSILQPASEAQLDARLTGDHEVLGSIPAESAAFFHGD